VGDRHLNFHEIRDNLGRRRGLGGGRRGVRLKSRALRCVPWTPGTSPERPAMCALARRRHAGMIVEVIEVRVR
jgi:hypothetical protein